MNEPTPSGLPGIDNIPEFTVSEISFAVKRTIETGFARVRVRGEISGLRRHGSGHVYFSLKDERAVLSAVCWRGMVGRLRHQPEDGLEVVCTGRLTTYPGRSQYQIVVEAIEPAGEGALLKLLEERRRRLAAEGLFDQDRKRPLPFLPEVIGVITSPTGAVIRDILHRLADRFPRRVLLWPARVQGEGAAEEVAAAIEGFNRLAPSGAPPRPDVIIVARGGGSLEDLWAFNEEIVVRAAAASAIPLISAVGHETDVTLIDHAADCRAPTPTAAAEMAVPVRAELVARLRELDGRLAGAMSRLVEARRNALRSAARALPDPRSVLDLATQRLDQAAERLASALFLGLERRRTRLASASAALRPAVIRRETAETAKRLAESGARLRRAALRAVEDARRRLESQARLLESCGYQQVLARGFVLVRDDAGRPVTAAAEARPGLGVALTFHDGERHATIDGGAPRKAPPGKAPSGKTPSDTTPSGGARSRPPGQGSLFE